MHRDNVSCALPREASLRAVCRNIVKVIYVDGVKENHALWCILLCGENTWRGYDKTKKL